MLLNAVNYGPGTFANTAPDLTNLKWDAQQRPVMTINGVDLVISIPGANTANMTLSDWKSVAEQINQILRTKVGRGALPDLDNASMDQNQVVIGGQTYLHNQGTSTVAMYANLQNLAKGHLNGVAQQQQQPQPQQQPVQQQQQIPQPLLNQAPRAPNPTIPQIRNATAQQMYALNAQATTVFDQAVANYGQDPVNCINLLTADDTQVTAIVRAAGIPAGDRIEQAAKNAAREYLISRCASLYQPKVKDQITQVIQNPPEPAIAPPQPQTWVQRAQANRDNFANEVTAEMGRAFQGDNAITNVQVRQRIQNSLFNPLVLNPQVRTRVDELLHEELNKPGYVRRAVNAVKAPFVAIQNATNWVGSWL